MVERTCRVCGCTEFNACQPPCWWVEDDLCSACDDDPVRAEEEDLIDEDEFA